MQIICMIYLVIHNGEDIALIVDVGFITSTIGGATI